MITKRELDAALASALGVVPDPQANAVRRERLALFVAAALAGGRAHWLAGLCWQKGSARDAVSYAKAALDELERLERENPQ